MIMAVESITPQPASLDPLKVAYCSQQHNSDHDANDDGTERSGTVWTASAHIITAVIGSGVLSLGWGVAQLGWVAGTTTLFLFSIITLFSSNLLADSYRSPNGTPNRTYIDAVRANLGEKMSLVCGIIQYINLSGTIIGYTITASISMVAIRKSNCFHMNKTREINQCKYSNNPYMISIGILEMVLSQIPNLNKLWWLSILAAVMSFFYASVAMGLSFAMVITGGGQDTYMTGVKIGVDVTVEEKVWRMFRSLGDIAFAFAYSQVLIEVQDTLGSKVAENKVMKRANVVSTFTTTLFYVMCGCLGYAAFGSNAPGNMLTGFGFYNPFWLVDLGNIAIIVHLIGAYQVFSQPLFNAFELWAMAKWPKAKMVTGKFKLQIGKRHVCNLYYMRLMCRTTFVAMATVLAMALPFFNDVLALLGAIGYWPLTIFFPIQMYIAQKKIQRLTCRWYGLNLLTLVCFLVALAAASGSIQGLNKALKETKPFKFKE